MDDTLQLREELGRAWRRVLTGAVERGFPAQAVVETMAQVAHERFSDLFGPQAAASYLQLLAEQLRAVDQSEAVSLVRGAPEPPSGSATDPERDNTFYDVDWGHEDSLI